MKKVGYWRSDREPDLPNPLDHVDTKWVNSEKNIVIKYLDRGEVKNRYRGWSTCRICECRNGSTSMTDGVWLWPSGLAHYLRKHNVKPPQEFINYIKGRVDGR